MNVRIAPHARNCPREGRRFELAVTLADQAQRLTASPVRSYSVGLVAPEFPPDIGGVESYSVELAKALTELGHRVTVFTVPHTAGEITFPGIPVLPKLRQRRRLDRGLLQEHSMDIWHATNAAYAWMALEAPNVVLSVHGNDFLRPYIELERPDLDRYALLWRLRGRTRAWLTSFDRSVDRWRTSRLLKRSLPAVPCIGANSRYTESVLIEKFPGCVGRTSVCLVGVAERFRAAQRRERPAGEPAHLLTICRLSEPRKNVDLVLRALAALKDRHRFRYTVIGDGASRIAIQRLAGELGLADRVRFAGYVSDDDLLRELASADLFVLTASALPTSHEGFGLVYLEANAIGVPVLAARLAGAVEAVEEGVSGMFVDEATVPQIERALGRFLAGEVSFDPEQCRQFAARFTWRAVAEHFTQCYERVTRSA